MFDLKLIRNNKNFVGMLVIPISAILSYLFIYIGNGFKYFSFSFLFIILSSLIFVLKKEKNTSHSIIFAGIIIFSFFILYRANNFLTFLNVISCAYLTTLLILGDYNYTGFLKILFSPFVILANILTVENEYKFNFYEAIKNIKINTQRISNIIISVIVTLLILLVIVPLLSYANPLFKKYVDQMGEIIDLLNSITILSEDLIITLIRIIFFLLLIIIIPRLLSFSNSSYKIAYNKFLEKSYVGLLMPKIAVATVLLVFFISQIQLYFSNEETLKILGYSNSRYAREVFAQLIVVSFIIFSLIYIDKLKNYWSKLSTYILIIEVVFLNFIALKSVYDYSVNWGLTIKRLYGYAVVLWLFGLLIFFIYNYCKNNENNKFIRNATMWSVSVLILINIANFDYIIYHYAPVKISEGIERYYLTELSADSRSYKEQLNDMSLITDDSRYAVGWSLISNIKSLKNEYSKFNIRTFNISRYLQYREIKDVDVDYYENLLNQNNPDFHR